VIRDRFEAACDRNYEVMLVRVRSGWNPLLQLIGSRQTMACSVARVSDETIN